MIKKHVRILYLALSYIWNEAVSGSFSRHFEKMTPRRVDDSLIGSIQVLPKRAVRMRGLTTEGRGTKAKHFENQENVVLNLVIGESKTNNQYFHRVCLCCAPQSGGLLWAVARGHGGGRAMADTYSAALLTLWQRGDLEVYLAATIFNPSNIFWRWRSFLVTPPSINILFRSNNTKKKKKKPYPLGCTQFCQLAAQKAISWKRLSYLVFNKCWSSS